MSTLNALKLSTAKKSLNTTPVVHRRNKLGKKLWEQIQLAQAHLAGKQFTTTRFQTVRDDDGVRRSVEVPQESPRLVVEQRQRQDRAECALWCSRCGTGQGQKHH